jgi:hypothetical protein
MDQNIIIAGTTIVNSPMNHCDANIPGWEAEFGAAGLLVAGRVSVVVADSSVAVSVMVDDTAESIETRDDIVVVTILEVRVTTMDVAVLVRVGGDAVSARIAVKLAVAADSSDLADASSEAILELALSASTFADSVATATAELARATTLLASKAASDISLCASDLASARTLCSSEALAEMAADTEATLVKIADRALSTVVKASSIGIGTARTVRLSESC